MNPENSQFMVFNPEISGFAEFQKSQQSIFVILYVKPKNVYTYRFTIDVNYFGNLLFPVLFL